MNKEPIFKFFCAISAGLTTALFNALGGQSKLLTFMLVAMAVDYATGLASGWINRELSSKIGFRGFAKKISALFFVALAAQAASLLGQPILRDYAIVYYLIVELISFLENMGKMGVQYPMWIKKRLIQIRKQVEETEFDELIQLAKKPDVEPSKKEA